MPKLALETETMLPLVTAATVTRAQATLPGVSFTGCVNVRLVLVVQSLASLNLGSPVGWALCC